MAKPRSGSLFKPVRSRKWKGAYTDPHTGKRVVKTLYVDKQASRAALDRMIRSAERMIEGLDDPHGNQRKRPITTHITEYLAHCRHTQQAPRHIVSAPQTPPKALPYAGSEEAKGPIPSMHSIGRLKGESRLRPSSIPSGILRSSCRKVAGARSS